jgi:hypothetical protein
MIRIEFPLQQTAKGKIEMLGMVSPEKRMM